MSCAGKYPLTFLQKGEFSNSPPPAPFSGTHPYSYTHPIPGGITAAEGYKYGELTLQFVGVSSLRQ
jgi:hypothetical protein